MRGKKVKLAMGQMLVEGGEVEQNLSRAREMIKKGAELGAEIIVLPECLDVGWTYPDAPKLAQPIPGKTSEFLCQCARDSGIYVVAGLTERTGNRTFNTGILISPDGKILLKHHKINILDIAQDIYSTGQSLSVVETPLGCIGLAICADNFKSSHVIGHCLARMGAQMILSPCAWAVPADKDLYTPEPVTQEWIDSYTTLTRLYDITIVGVSNVGWLKAGPWKGYKCIGGSLAVGPGGKILAQLPLGENAVTIQTVEIRVIEQKATGTKIAEMLAQKGYNGP